MDHIAISSAAQADVDAIKAILIGNNLPTAGVDDHWRSFVIARAGGTVIGCAGAEMYQGAALIRSVAVVPEYRSRGVGHELVRQLLDRLTASGLREFYLLTTTAENYFGRRGFEKIDRSEVHPQLLASREFQDACPKSAVCMRLVTHA
ncbi:MAG TPA: arsenic resistance N-acetyltransferase ArsN2 [Thermoanaerobaculia bacterium]|jgi:N-acetylglutamate synthase-like GNAT family acetyltransferase|nr:arsenic resistance N-acetyltransferase ArsN2 [Thermoanaerobaculia bacterium]